MVLVMTVVMLAMEMLVMLLLVTFDGHGDFGDMGNVDGNGSGDMAHLAWT